MLAAGHADAPRALRRERVQRRNQQEGEAFLMVAPPHFFELASAMWEPLDNAERDGRDVRIVSTEGCTAGAPRDR